MNKNFNQLYQQLNADQKRAVNTIEGPVLCLAGPGTGKTQVLTLRIANILKRSQMNPYNILCLTFTDTASNEMRERLISLIGNEGFDATIATFHSFSQSIIAEFPDLFGYSVENQAFSFNDLKPLDDLSRYKIIEKILLKKKWQYLKPAKQNLHYLEKIVKAISEIKRERLTNKNILAENKKDRSLQKKIERTKELFNFFKFYQKELAKNGFYDYEDMIDWVVDEMETNHDLALILQERYQYILIDEYQDSNNAQIALVKNLTSFYGDKANVFAVGDPHQSIYRFQGASDLNIKWFKKHFPKAKIINLKTSYRAHQNLLDNAKAIISADKKTEKLKSSKAGKGNFDLIEYETQDQEIDSVAIAIKQLIKHGAKTKNIAILLRQNNQIQNYLDALARYNIPFQTLKPGNIFDSPIIFKMLAIYRFLIQPQKNENWGELAFYLRENLGLDQTGKLLKLNANIFLKNSKQQNQVSAKTRQLIKQLLRISENLTDLPPAKILQEISDCVGITQNTLKKPNKLELLADLKSLFDLAKNSQKNSLDFITDIDAMIRLGLGRDSVPLLFGEENAVVAQTVHQAKGREYKTIFLPEMQEKLWLKNDREHFAFSLDNKIIDKNIARQIADNEARRLFYVGLTRAKKNIFVSYAKNRADGKNNPSRLTHKLGQEEKIKIMGDKLSEAKKRVIKEYQTISPTRYNKNEKAFLTDAVKNFILTPTNFNAYLKCPQDFLFKHIIRIPQIKKPFLSYGTAIHKAMEIFAKQFIATSALPSKNFLIDGFLQAIAKELLGKKESENLILQGEKLLNNYYEKMGQNFTKPIWLEYDFKKHHIHLGKILLSGKIDKIEWLDKKRWLVRVIDYKTGRARSLNEIRGLTKKADESYLNQLKFYWLLGQLDRRFSAKWKIGEVRLDFLDDELKFKQRPFVFSDQEIDELKKQIKSVYKNIQALKFTHIETPGKPCDWCVK